MTTTMALLMPTHRQDKCVSHALQVRASWALSNYHRFFQLYRCAPKMSGYVIDWFLERERKQALKIMIKSYVSCRILCDVIKLTFEYS